MRPSSAVSTLLFFLSVITGALFGFALFQAQHDPALFVLPLFGGLVLGVLLSASVKVVAQWERMIVLRLGRYQGTFEPGMRLLIPVFDTPIFVDMRVQTLDVQRQQAITQDNVPVIVNGVIFFRVTDAAAAAIKV